MKQAKFCQIHHDYTTGYYGSSEGRLKGTGVKMTPRQTLISQTRISLVSMRTWLAVEFMPLRSDKELLHPSSV